MGVEIVGRLWMCTEIKLEAGVLDFAYLTELLVKSFDAGEWRC